MKKTFLCTLYLVTLSLFLGCAKKATAEPQTAGNDKPVVYMTQEISPAALVRIYEALGRPAEGRVADKMIGKAAAALMAVGGVKQVHTNLISTPAREMLEKAGVQVTAAEEVEMILNRDQTGQCPMDQSLNETDDPAECMEILKIAEQ